MSNQIPIVDPYEFLGIVKNPDGTLTRNNLSPTVFVPVQPDTTNQVLSKDITINNSTATWLRLYIPGEALNTSNRRLPLVIYFHGGGFIGGTVGWFDGFVSNLSHDLHAIVASVSYRLAPEHRLPAAYDDAVESLHFLKSAVADDDWLKNYADLSNVYLAGTSAGANIAYIAGLRAVEMVGSLSPLHIRGLILHHAFFGGSTRSGSEIGLMNSPFLPPIVSDLMWELSLPIGVDRDHEYSNPTVGGGSKVLEKVKDLGWRVFVNGCSGDLFIDRQTELAELMRDKGICVEDHFNVGDFHGVEIFDRAKAKLMNQLLKDFIYCYLNYVVECSTIST